MEWGRAAARKKSNQIGLRKKEREGERERERERERETEIVKQTQSRKKANEQISFCPNECEEWGDTPRLTGGKKRKEVVQ